MSDKEVDVLINYIVEEYNFDCICDKLHEKDYCEKHCSYKDEKIRECVREYARVCAEEGAADE